MSIYRQDWHCCGNATYTDAWQPEACPFCTTIPKSAVRKALAELREKLQPGLFWTEGTHARAMADFDATMTALGLGDAEPTDNHTSQPSP